MSIKKRQSILLSTVIMCATFVLISISWAAFSSTLTVGGTGNVSAQSWDIDFTNTVGTKWTAAQKLSGTSTSLAELPASTDTDAFGIPEDGKAKGFLGTLKMSGDKITYTWYVQNFGTLDATYTINGVIATNTYANGSNVEIDCNTSTNSTDKTFCNNYVKTIVTVDGDVTTPTSTYTLGKAGSSTDHATVILTIEITGTNQIYTGTVAAHYENDTRAKFLTNIQKLSGSSSDLNISVKGLSLVEKQDISEISTKESTTTISYASHIGETESFDYLGSEKEYTIPYPGNYLLEVWGAQGGVNSTCSGGYGAYAMGVYTLEKDQKIYINVGGQGSASCNSDTTIAGGYNGGGEAYTTTGQSGRCASSGGGATHIALSSGLLSTFENNKSSVLIVAGAGSGTWYYDSSATSTQTGHGGGIEGVMGISYASWVTPQYHYSYGGLQDSANPNTNTTYNVHYGSFGQGANASNSEASGGGAGWYGGNNALFGAGGGSSYIGNVKSTDNYTKVMYCYNCTESTEANTYTIKTANTSSTPTSRYAKEGNGYAKITYLG